MNSVDFYYSCKARCIGGFGGGENGDDEVFNLNTNNKGELLSMIRAAKAYGSPKILFAVTTSNQPYTEELLENFGFMRSQPSETSGDREITGWVLSVDHFDETKVK